MISPHGDQPAGPDDQDDEPGSPDIVENALHKFQRTVETVGGQRRRLLDAAGWWVIRVVLAVAAVILLVFGRVIEAGACVVLFGVTFFAR